MPRSKDVVSVKNVDDMVQQDFRRHCKQRHPNLGFWSKGEHESAHRLYPEILDHTHEGANDDDGDDAGTVAASDGESGAGEEGTGADARAKTNAKPSAPSGQRSSTRSRSSGRR